jgi:hypothetical protein
MCALDQFAVLQGTRIHATAAYADIALGSGGNALNDGLQAGLSLWQLLAALGRADRVAHQVDAHRIVFAPAQRTGQPQAVVGEFAAVWRSIQNEQCLHRDFPLSF